MKSSKMVPSTGMNFPLLIFHYVDKKRNTMYPDFPIDLRIQTARGIIPIEHVMLNGRKEKVNLLNGISILI